MTEADLQNILDQLINNWENEVVEFKQADNNYDTDKIGRYFSALSNEANLHNIERAWFILGVDDKTRSIVGTNYRTDPERLQSLKMQILNETTANLTFRNIYELNTTSGRVVLCEIPPAPQGMPISWKGHHYSRAGESITPMGLDKLDEMRHQTMATDWSAQIVSDATLNDLDPKAIQKARRSFIIKHANRFSQDEIDEWTDEEFLNRAEVTQDGKITRAALLLLGKQESSYLLNPHPAQMTWKLEGEERAYEHFSPPFFLNTTQLYRKIRNIQLRILPADELVPIEISKYDQKIVLEALHNCVAHQDYSRNGRINVIEKPEELIFENEGSFFEGKPDDYILGEKMPRRYRNPFLVKAMVGLNMIDKMGYGIHDMHKGQAKRYLPLPDYNLLEDDVVRTTIYGGVVDPAYNKLLMQNTDLPLEDILALDRVQKQLPIPDEKAQHLRTKNLIEGRKPNFSVSAVVAAATANKADYMRTRSLDNKHYKELIVDYIKKFGKASRKDIDKWLPEKLSGALTPYQKSRKVGNLLTNLRQEGVIYNNGSSAKPEWKLTENN